MLMAKKKPAGTWRQRLKRVREDLGITQVEAAERLGVPVRTWIGWENNQRNPSRTAQALLKITFPEHF